MKNKYEEPLQKKASKLNRASFNFNYWEVCILIKLWMKVDIPITVVGNESFIAEKHAP